MKRLLLIVAMLSGFALAGIGPAKVKADGTGRQCLMRCETTCAVQAAVAANAAQLMGADGEPGVPEHLPKLYEYLPMHTGSDTGQPISPCGPSETAIGV